MDGDASLRLRVLGELAATRDGAVVDLGGRRQRAVLAALVVMRGQVVPAERLVDCVWGDHPPGRGTAAIQAYVSHLRRRLEPEAGARRRDRVIASTGAGYTLRLAPETIDACCFEQAVDRAATLEPADAVRALDDALALWRGAPYSEYAGEPWVEAETVRLTELRGVARERRLEGRLQLGDAALLVGDLEALVAEDPLREERWRLLALALYRAHRQADALAALRRARATLADELGIDPGPALRALEADVLAQSPTLDAPTAPPAPVVVTPEVAGPAPSVGAAARAVAAGSERTPSAGLVDRARETAALRRAVDDVVAGTSGCLLVEGPAGIGKTRLLVEATRLATAGGARVLSARGSQLEQSFGFGTVRQLFEPALGDPDRREALLRGAARHASAVFDEVADDAPAQQGSFAVLHGLYWLTVNLTAAGPVALVVDDVQWCDSASLRYLAYLAKRLEGLPLLVVLAVRTGEPHADDVLLAEIALDPSTIVLRPPPLSAEAAGALVRERLGEGADSFVDACHRMTSGNPLLLRQLLRALEDEGIPPDVSHVDTARAVGSRAVSALVTLRLRRLPVEVAATAQAVAVLGDAAELPTVAALAQRPEARGRCRARRPEPQRDPHRRGPPLLRPSVDPRSRLRRPAGGRAGAAPRAGSRHPAAPGRTGRTGGRPPAALAPTRQPGHRRGAAGRRADGGRARRSGRGGADAPACAGGAGAARGALDAARRARRGRGLGRRARCRRAPDRGVRPAARRRANGPGSRLSLPAPTSSSPRPAWPRPSPVPRRTRCRPTSRTSGRA